ncbi:Na+/H+ antiporter subunit E [Synechococcus sp. Cruz-9H2]|nr:Na+/H+ antiporter subunit E [Synechococcus sp. Cruz-9H2]MCP9844973.1 Na+/H+ antiporter subunit E [Synechococcus sp. Edmonson 11F2]MCP9857094.1 Na+/H+ antiporter subunit E [Synechococcus sp. Cruz-9C9]MCP9864379.1 Na+/H+ antiporter subunit E [Synechococcus sp. Cruz-7E5]MCP9871681.1 Na+/H+ antiporter subunit E [Synechococcus sp. Cruz-7B9]
MPLLLSIGFRLALWCLLTSDLSWLNLLIGLVVALLLPRARSRPLPLRALLLATSRSLLAIPQAYGEALRLIFAPAVEEREASEPATDRALPLLVFLDVFRITLTPFTIVLGLEDDGRRYRIHSLMPASKQDGSRL